MATDLLRLAWEAGHDGRTRLRDSLLTLAIAESLPDDHWAERCRSRLVAERPDHFLSQFPSVAIALQDDRVAQARDRLRVKYPIAKVRSLLLKAAARRGPYLGRVESLDAMIEDLAGSLPETENVRRDAPQASRGPLNRQRASRPLVWSLAYPPMKTIQDDPWQEGLKPAWETSAVEVEDDPRAFVVYYTTVLLAIAFLMASVQPSPDDDRSSAD